MQGRQVPAAGGVSLGIYPEPDAEQIHADIAAYERLLDSMQRDGAFDPDVIAYIEDVLAKRREELAGLADADERT